MKKTVIIAVVCLCLAAVVLLLFVPFKSEEDRIMPAVLVRTDGSEMEHTYMTIDGTWTKKGVFSQERSFFGKVKVDALDYTYSDTAIYRAQEFELVEVSGERLSGGFFYNSYNNYEGFGLICTDMDREHYVLTTNQAGSEGADYLVIGPAQTEEDARRICDTLGMTYPTTSEPSAELPAANKPFSDMEHLIGAALEELHPKQETGSLYVEMHEILDEVKGFKSTTVYFAARYAEYSLENGVTELRSGELAGAINARDMSVSGSDFPAYVINNYDEAVRDDNFYPAVAEIFPSDMDMSKLDAAFESLKERCDDYALRHYTSELNSRNMPPIDFTPAIDGNTEALFADYNGEAELAVHGEIVRDASGIGLRTTRPDWVFYWHDEAGDATPEEAAKELVRVMLESVNAVPEEVRDMTITDYEIGEQTLYGSDSARELYLEGYPGLVLPENAWVFDPSLTFSYTGEYHWYTPETMEEWLIADNGMFREFKQGSDCLFYELIIRDGDVWRMESLDKFANEHEEVGPGKAPEDLTEILALNLPKIFADYDGGDSQLCRRSEDTVYEGIPTGDTVYWRDGTGKVTPEEAARELIRVMLEEINALPEEERTFTVTQYKIPEQTLYGTDDLKSTYISPTREDCFGVILPENAWLFQPEFGYDFEGTCNLWERDAVPESEFNEDGLLEPLYQGEFGYHFYIILRDGDVWRLQSFRSLRNDIGLETRQ